jgi:hypothetical protein
MEDFGSSLNILENEYTNSTNDSSSEDGSSLSYESVPLEDGHLGGHDEQNDQVESFFQNLDEVCILCSPIYF